MERVSHLSHTTLLTFLPITKKKNICDLRSPWICLLEQLVTFESVKLARRLSRLHQAEPKDKNMAGHDTHSSEEADTEFTTSEETPLLTASGSSTTADEQDPREKYRTQVLVLSFLAIFLIEISVGVCTPAWAALIEKGLCSEMNPDIADHLVLGENNPFCKSPEVQGKLALIRGWNYTIELIPSTSLPCIVVDAVRGKRMLTRCAAVALFFAIPFGAMSDSWGRKPVLLLSFFGVFLTTVWYEVVRKSHGVSFCRVEAEG